MQTAVRTVKVITFTACRDIWIRAGTHPIEYVLVAPALNWWSEVYPATVQMGLFVEFTGASGEYYARIDVYDVEGDHVVCLSEDKSPFVSNDPVRVHTCTLQHKVFQVPRPGLYDIVLSFNGEEAARRQLWVRPPDLSA